jgi:PKD domain
MANQAPATSTTAQTVVTTNPPQAQVAAGAVAQTPTQQFQQQMMNKPTMSGKTIAIWCGVFFVIFAVIMMVALLAALQNPSSLESIGITPETVKTVVKGIILFVALLFFFAWFGLAVWSGYRLFTKKEWNKIGYIAGLIGWFFALVLAIVWGTVGITSVNAMDTSGITASNIINPYLVVKQTSDRRVKNGKVYLGEPGLKVIAPANIAFQFSQEVFNRNIGPSLNGWVLQSVTLDCGNGQTINWFDPSSKDLYFVSACLYLNKWVYSQSLTYRYADKLTKQVKEATLSNLFSITVDTEIKLSTKAWAYTLNDAKNEIIAGENPSQLIIDATSVATDLNLVNSIINWDMDSDGQDDKQRVNFSHYLYEPKLHTISYSLPEYPWIIYQLPVRVLQSNVPSCTVATQTTKGNQYRLEVKLADAWVSIDRYQFEIVDKLTDELVDSVDSDKSSTVYDFAPGRQYQVRAFFTTDDQKQWVCETDNLAVNNSSYAIKSTISVKYPNATSYTDLVASGADNVVKITTVPAQLQLKIDEITPPIARPAIKVMHDGTQINPSSQQTFMIKIESKKDHTITVVVTDEQGKTSTQQYKVVSDVSPIVGVVKADKKVWFDPLTVTLDASISQLNDANDEVVYFTWDFGDGTIVKNVSQWSIKHVYRFAEGNESGAYRPRVTVTTQKWHTDTIELSDDIVVKRAIRDVKITSPTHPAQLARVGDQVQFAISTDGPIKSVAWDFGNGQTATQEGRQGTEATMNYLQAGIYDVIAVVEFSDHPPVTQNMKIKVE